MEQASDPSGPDPAPAEHGRGPLRWELYAFLELCALCGLAVAQPLLDVIGRSPDFLLFHGAGRGQVLVLLAAVVLAPPLVLWAVGMPAWLSGRTARRVTHTVLVGTLVAIFAVQLGKHILPVRGLPLAGIATLAGVAAAVAYARLAVLGQILRVAAAGPLVFVLLFVFASPASAVLLGGNAGGAAQAAAGREVGPHPSIVVILFDELPLVSLLDRAGRLDAGRVPNFADLAGDSTWYRNATGVSPHTTYAVPSMLTGRYPTGELAPHHSNYPENLFTLLGAGYDIQAWETVTQLCPPRYCRDSEGTDHGGLPAMFEESASLLGRMASPYDSNEDPTAGFREETVAEDVRRNDRPPDAGPDFRMSRLAENQPTRFSDFLSALPRPAAGLPQPTAAATPSGSASPPSAPVGGGRPVLRFLHLLIPHSPWLYLSSGMRYDGPGDLPFDGQWWARLAYQRHMQQVGYSDILLGEAVRALKSAGLYDESLIVVTADHGDSFSQGVSGRDMDTGQRAAAEVAWVPLFIKEPGQRGSQVDDRNWQHVDLLPTLADYAGFQPSWRVEGVSALRQRRADGDKRFDQEPGKPMTVPTAAHFPAVLRGSAARPVLPEVSELALVGRSVGDFPAVADGPPVVVANAAEFDNVRPERGKIPALVDATLPGGAAQPPAGTPIAIALNGRIGAVALAAKDHDGELRVVGLVEDERLLQPGANRLELYVISGDPSGWRLRTCRIDPP